MARKAERIRIKSLERFLGNADRFYMIGLLLNGSNRTLKHALMHGQVVNLVLAFELYLKVLTVVEGKEGVLKTHSLVRLFGDISPDSQKIIRDTWLKVNKPKLKALKKQGWPGKVPSHLIEALQQAGNLFEDWRYFDKEKGGDFLLYSFGSLVRNRIHALRPDLKPNPGSLFAEIDPDPQLVERESDPPQGDVVRVRVLDR